MGLVAGEAVLAADLMDGRSAGRGRRGSCGHRGLCYRYLAYGPKIKEMDKKAMGGVLLVGEAYYLHAATGRDYGQKILLNVMEARERRCGGPHRNGQITVTLAR